MVIFLKRTNIGFRLRNPNYFFLKNLTLKGFLQAAKNLYITYFHVFSKSRFSTRFMSGLKQRNPLFLKAGFHLCFKLNFSLSKRKDRIT